MLFNFFPGTLQLALDAEKMLAEHSSVESADDFQIYLKQKRLHLVQHQYLNEEALDLNSTIGEENLMHTPETTTPATIISDDNGKEPTLYHIYL